MSILLTLFLGKRGKSANDVSDPSSTMQQEVDLDAGELSLDLAPPGQGPVLGHVLQGEERNISLKCLT